MVNINEKTKVAMWVVLPTLLLLLVIIYEDWCTIK